MKNETQGSSLGQKNSHSGNSSDRGDENHSKGDIGKTHTTLVDLERKRDVTQK
jgi:hypothetical protein